MPNFLHEVVLKRESQQELHDWQSSISHAIAQQNLVDPWEADILASSAGTIHPTNEDLGVQ